VWVRGRRKNTRALARLAGPGSGFGRRARARDMRVNGSPKSGPILGERGFLLQIYFATMNLLRISRAEFLRLVTDLVFGMPKTLAVPSNKYARVPARKRTQQKTHNTPRPACCAAAYATSSRPSACTGDWESRSLEPRPQRSCTGRGRIKFLGSALRDCSNASTSPSSTSSSPRLVFLLVSGARLGVVKRAEVLIVAVIFSTRLFRSA
jgi:hypothetical protein